MKKISLGKLVGGMLKAAPSAQLWQPDRKPYPRLRDMDVGPLKGRQGIYAIWHLGVRPQWLHVGASADLGGTLAAVKAAPWIVLHEDNAGVFAAWAFAPPGEGARMARFLAETLKPAFQAEACAGDLPLEAPPVATPLPPGTGP